MSRLREVILDTCVTGAGAAADVGWLVIYLFRNACQSSGGPGQGWCQCKSDKNAEVKIIHIMTVFKHREKKQKQQQQELHEDKRSCRAQILLGHYEGEKRVLIAIVLWLKHC